MNSMQMKLAQEALNLIENLQKLEAIIEEGDLPRSENEILGNGEKILLKCNKCGLDFMDTYELTNISECLKGQILAIKEEREKYEEDSEEAFFEEDEYIRNQRFLDAKTLETYGKLKDIEKEAKSCEKLMDIEEETKNCEKLII